ncbi:MAG TPA: hypothetical protein VH141_02930 [Pseudonocardia sp.]|jgi:hypothetical protein|nr:hypothetical protein [Pseudonocardia sp.]
MPTVEERRAAQLQLSAQTRCDRCGDPVVGCRDPEGRVVAVHPVAVPGGELIINGSQCRIVAVLTSREASAAHRRGDLGFTVHARFCRRPGRR